MGASRDWEKTVRRIEQLLRLKSFPVAFKMVETKGALSDIPFMRRVSHKVTLCQLISLVRNFDWTVGADKGDFITPMCPSIIGLSDLPEFMKDGTFRSIVWTKNRSDGKKYEEGVPRLPLGKYEAVAMAPLVYNPFDPDIVLLYANPAQMIVLINALQFEEYEVMEFSCVGESSCSDAISRCYLSGKPKVSIPCYGERRYGHAQDDELVMALPPDLIDKALRGLEALYKRGVRYPISYAGAETDVTFAFPASYSSMSMIEGMRGDDGRLLVGLTGGTASGATTVALMLEDLGAHLIEFDELSKAVVEPEKPAWKDIVSYFGEHILRDDNTLDQQSLSEIVQRDMEKRKKLDGFTRPRITEEFIKEVGRITKSDPKAVIVVTIRHLIEMNLQSIFHTIVVVYATEEKQIERMMTRDGIDRETAANKLASQLSLEEKKGYADMVVNNAGSIEATRQRVEAIWSRLKDMQKQR